MTMRQDYRVKGRNLAIASEGSTPRYAMDDFEKRVLKHAKAHLGENVDINGDFLESVHRAGLITEDMAQGIKHEKTPAARAHHLVECVSASTEHDSFERFMQVLMTDHSWLAKELQAEVKAERGKLEIDEDVMKEAAMMVHRKFGSSKRLGELDKKDMTELIAVKIQLSKEEWREEVSILKKEIKHLEDIIKAENTKARDIERYVRHFVKDNDSRLLSRAHGMKTTSDVLKSSISDDDILAILRSRIEHLTRRMRVVMEERDLFYDDRDMCYQAIGVKADSVPLYELIKSKIASSSSGSDSHNAAAEQNGSQKTKVEDKDATIKHLRKLVNKYEAELDEYDEKVQPIKDDLKAERDRNAELLQRINELEDEQTDLKERLEAQQKKGGRKSSKSN